LQNAPAAQKERIVELSSQLKPEERAKYWDEVRNFVTDNGGIDFCFTMARRFGDEAKNALGPVASGPQKDLLAVAVEYVINRLN